MHFTIVSDSDMNESNCKGYFSKIKKTALSFGKKYTII